MMCITYIVTATRRTGNEAKVKGPSASFSEVERKNTTSRDGFQNGPINAIRREPLNDAPASRARYDTVKLESKRHEERDDTTVPPASFPTESV